MPVVARQSFRDASHALAGGQPGQTLQCRRALPGPHRAVLPNAIVDAGRQDAVTLDKTLGRPQPRIVNTGYRERLEGCHRLWRGHASKRFHRRVGNRRVRTGRLLRQEVDSPRVPPHTQQVTKRGLAVCRKQRQHGTQRRHRRLARPRQQNVCRLHPGRVVVQKRRNGIYAGVAAGYDELLAGPGFEVAGGEGIRDQLQETLLERSARGRGGIAKAVLHGGERGSALPRLPTHHGCQRVGNGGGVLRKQRLGRNGQSGAVPHENAER